MLFIAGWSGLFTWVYIGTAGSLPSALSLHTSINTVSIIISRADPRACRFSNVGTDGCDGAAAGL